ncbi:MAG: TolC family protein [Planctomycetes bacterium]|nr:TolC family protein [Planctomycetota bacterium]
MSAFPVGAQRQRRRLVATSICVALGGCTPFYELAPDVRQRIAAESDGLSPKISDHEDVRRVAERAAHGVLADPAPIAVRDGSGLADYIRWALDRNPRLQARVRDIEALGMRVPQVSSLGDPMLSLVPPTGDLVQTAGGAMQAAVGLSQGLPWPGKLETLGKVAEHVVRIAISNLDTERLRVVADVKQAYFDLYRARVSIDVSRALEVLLQRVRDSAQSRITTGLASQQDLLRTEVELYALTNARLDYEQESTTARARLNVLMDRPVDARLPMPGPLEAAPLQWRLLALLQRADEFGPQLAALRTRIEADLLRVDYADLAYYPDLGLGGLFTFIASGGRSPVADGSDVWNLNLGVTLPIFRDKLDAGVLQRNAEAIASVHRYRDGRNRVVLALQQQLARVDADYRKAVLLRDGILPRADQAVRVAQTGYDAGTVEFATLLAAWRRLFELTLDYHRALAALEHGVSEVEYLAGGDLPREEPREIQEDER